MTDTRHCPCSADLHSAGRPRNSRCPILLPLRKSLRHGRRSAGLQPALRAQKTRAFDDSYAPKSPTPCRLENLSTLRSTATEDGRYSRRGRLRYIWIP
jgi:hypothetical protein